MTAFRLVTCGLILACAGGLFGDDPEKPQIVRDPKLAGIATVFRTNSHAEMIIGRWIRTKTLDDRGQRLAGELVSLYVDQLPRSDLSRSLAAERGIPLYNTPQAALTRGTGALAVDGILLVAEHGDYPDSETGQKVYPKRRLFSAVAEVCRKSKRAVPVFIDKHLADNWTDAKWIYDTARELKIPLMAGSSLPSYRRDPAVDVRRGAKLKQIVGVSYGALDAYGFHGLEMLQCLVERRAGGETGVRAVRSVTGQAVWTSELFDRTLLDACIARLKRPRIRKGKTLEESVPKPVLYHVEYNDGLIANLLTLNGAVQEFSAAWRYVDGSTQSTLFDIQDNRPYMHFARLTEGIEQMMQTRRPTWPVERTLLTTGVLDAAFISMKNAGAEHPTPYLSIKYKSDWNWHQPPAD